MEASVASNLVLITFVWFNVSCVYVCVCRCVCMCLCMYVCVCVCVCVYQYNLRSET